MGKYTIRSGVYQIVNEVNGKSYVGSSKDISNRWANWKRNFKQPMKYKSLLKIAVGKYGIANFTFIILEECDPAKEVLEERENYWLDLIRPEYNILKKAYSPVGMVKPPMSDEAKAKIRAARALQVMPKGADHPLFGRPSPNKGKPSPLRGTTRPPEVCAKVSASLMGHTMPDSVRQALADGRRGKPPPMAGKCHSAATKEIIREKRKEQVFTEEHRKQRSERMTGPGNHFFGKTHTSETKAIIVEKRALQTAAQRADPTTKNESGYKGVIRHGSGWRPFIWVNNKPLRGLGTYRTPEEAYAVRCAKLAEL